MWFYFTSINTTPVTKIMHLRLNNFSVLDQRFLEHAMLVVILTTPKLEIEKITALLLGRDSDMYMRVKCKSKQIFLVTNI